MDKIKVTIDKDLMDIIPDYINHRLEDCEKIEKLLAEKNLEEIKRIGHKMAGSGGGYGFDEISKIGKAIETEALSNPGSLLNHCENLKKYLDNLEIVYE